MFPCACHTIRILLLALSAARVATQPKYSSEGSTYVTNHPSLNLPETLCASATTTSVASLTSVGGNIWNRLSSPGQSPQMAQKHRGQNKSHNNLQSYYHQQQQLQQPQPPQLNRALSAGASIKAMFLPLAQSNLGAPQAALPPPPSTPTSPKAPSQPTTPTSSTAGSIVKSKAVGKVIGELIRAEETSYPNHAGWCIQEISSKSIHPGKIVIARDSHWIFLVFLCHSLLQRIFVSL
ncbi:hypothetical protein PoB_006986200 [Plakobranchus ocellatus]|uniref:Uncharacterized protein n=1 Tax=Plakobranchus ocellatus TaxID=259542 RepID=A0AAV4DH91_9GAST|nr:hypothetical protein PoB_006986200 [Plakobranchus ocellatus]